MEQGKTPHKEATKKDVITMGVNTMGYEKALHGALGVARWATGSPIARRKLEQSG